MGIGFFIYFNYFVSDSKNNQNDLKPNIGPKQQNYKWICGPCMSEGLKRYIIEEGIDGDPNSDTCPDCTPRNGRVETLEIWELLGGPKSGFSVCGVDCTCRLVPVNDN